MVGRIIRLRHLMVLPAIAVALSAAFTGVASAQTLFQASVSATGVRGGGPVLSSGCSNGAFYCGTANIAGYGAASWNLYVTGLTIVPTSCGSLYTATTDFTLASDRSTLRSTRAATSAGRDSTPTGTSRRGASRGVSQRTGIRTTPMARGSLTPRTPPGSSPGSADRARTFCKLPARTPQGATAGRSASAQWFWGPARHE